MIDPHIFRAYDIRGKALTQLTEEACERIGRGFGTVLRRMYKKDHPTVVLGRDARTHSPLLEEAVRRGLLSTGCHILDIGQTASPVNYFTICDKKCDGGAQITASHNPKEDNGIKLQVRDADAFSGDRLQALRMQIEQNDFVSGEGEAQTYDAIAPYRNALIKKFSGAGKKRTVIIDGGNGVAGPLSAEVLQKTGAKVTGIYLEPDGNFPNHPADPSKPSTLKDLQEKVKSEQADLGIAFDGDGDRIGLVDENGVIRTADEILLLLAKDHLSRHPGNPVIFTVSNSSTLETEVQKWGGRPVMCKVGHSFVEHAMREHNALLGGEQSGHFFCGEEYYGFDDALVASLRLLDILAKSGATMSELMAGFPKVYQVPELRPYCPDDKKEEIISAITAHFKEHYPVNTLDGVRIDFGDGGWAGIRQSNTSPYISVCMEARSERALRTIERKVTEHLKHYPEIEM